MLTPYTEWRTVVDAHADHQRFARLWAQGQVLNFRRWTDVPRLRWA